MDPLEAASRWHGWAVAGTESQIGSVLVSLDANLPPGWKRLAGNDLAQYQSLVRSGSGWYAMDPTPAHAGVTLSLEKLKGSELRGGRVWFSGPGYPGLTANIPAAWDQIIGLLEDGIIPAARTAGLNFRLPSSEDIFFAELPSGVREQLRSFCEAARKSLPLSREEAELWNEFVIAAFRSRTVIDSESFVRWLVASGWQRESAKELNFRFFDQCLLLSRFADEVLTA
jgi:hypothetical protein